VPATARASFYLYNTLEEVDRLVSALETVQRLFRPLDDGAPDAFLLD